MRRGIALGRWKPTFGTHDLCAAGILLFTADARRLGRRRSLSIIFRYEKACDPLMASSLPNLTPEQRATALQKAAETRAKRSEFTACLRTGETSGADGLEEALGDEVLGKIKLTSFLRALPGWGKVSVENFLESNTIAENRRLGGLGSIQLTAVRDAVSS